jgi:outer membrane protein
MLVVHAISGTKKGGRLSRQARLVILAIERRRFSTAAASSEGLIQCGPALTEEAIGKHSEVHSRNQVPRSSIDPMKSKYLRVLLAIAVTFTFSAWAQTGSAATPSGPTAAPANPAPSAPTTTAGPGTGTKVGTINIQEAIFGSNEGRRDLEALGKKYEPKQNELKSQNDELEGLKKQLSTTQDKLNEEALATLKKQIETKQKSFDRAYQDFQEEAGGQQQEIATRVLQKMAPMIVKYSEDNGFGMIVDTSKPWPQSNVLWWGQAVDITKAIVDAYNVQSGVPAPPPAGAAKPAAPKPSNGAGASKPAAPKPTTPPQ